MASEKFHLIASAALRFVRSFVAQMVVYVPAMLVWLNENPEMAKLVTEYIYWLVPVLAFVSSVLLSGDKLVRDLKRE